MTETILKKRDTCYACVVRCKRVVEIKEGPHQVDPLYGGPEYETLGTFGSYCGVSDLAAISEANQICNEYGVDTISCGATIAFAMECFEKGHHRPGGYRRDRAALWQRRCHAGGAAADRREPRAAGTGALAEGSARAAKAWGPAAEDCLITVKGTGSAGAHAAGQEDRWA